MTDWMSEKVVVLAGGPSCEREISLISGKAVLDALVSRGISTVMLDPVGDFLATLRKENASIVFLALHGTFGEDGTIQKILEGEGFLYTGSGISVSELAFDKSRTQGLFHKAGIRIPEFMTIERHEAIALPKKFSFPLVVKPTASGSSIGVSILSAPEDYEKAVLSAFQYSESVLVDQYIKGRELTVGFLADQPLPIVEVIVQRKFYDYEAKYHDHTTRYEFPAQLTADEAELVTEMAVRAYRALGCEVMARVDIMLGGDKQPYVLEVNTIPGLTHKSLLPKAASAAGIDFPELCVRILDLSLACRRSPKRPSGTGGIKLKGSVR